MRIVPLGSFDRLAAPALLWNAYLACRRGKRHQPNMAGFDIDADRAVIVLHRQLNDGRYRPSHWSLRVIKDPKTRLIAAPAIRDRVVHRALLDEIGPYFERSYIDHSFTGSDGRGPHRATLCFLGWMRRFDYRMHLDIRRYFLCIHHPTLCGLLFEKVRDNATRQLVVDLLHCGRAVYDKPLARQALNLARYPVGKDCGLPLGSYLSQWSGTYYLNGLDHFVKRVLKIKAYLRYMDDFVLFSDNAEELEQAKQGIAEWLLATRRLTLNPKHMTVMPCREPAIFLGYRISRSGVSPSKKLRRRMTNRIRVAAEKGHEPLVRCLQSYKGLLLF